nr:Xaa-Pro peptidase family protein [Moorella sp. Hama-1]
MSFLPGRLEQLRALMVRAGISALWVRQEENRRYLSGFTGDSGSLIITPTAAYLLTDGRFSEQARKEAPDFQVVDLGPDPWDKMGTVLVNTGIEQLSFEAEYTTYATYAEFQEHARDWEQPVTLAPVKNFIDKLRQVKDQGEIATLERAIAIADAGFNHLLTILRPGLTERDVALELEYYLGKQGSSGPSFTTIIASGPRSALPHGVAGERILQPGDLVVMDFGAVYDGYHSDLTRTVALAPAPGEWRRLYDLVLAAQEKAITAIRPGMTGREVDAVAREHIAAAGYGEYFSHGLGHGVGLAIHEAPTLSIRSEVQLAPGMVVTVEPGVYLPGQGGIRIEDVVLIQEGGARVLSRAPKNFIEV